MDPRIERYEEIRYMLNHIDRLTEAAIAMTQLSLYAEENIRRFPEYFDDNDHRYVESLRWRAERLRAETMSVRKSLLECKKKYSAG